MHFFFPTQLVPARTRTQVVWLGAQCTDHWTTEQSRGVGVPAVQLTTHVKSSTLYGRTSKFFRLDGLLLFCIIMGLCSVSSAIKYLYLGHSLLWGLSSFLLYTFWIIIIYYICYYLNKVVIKNKKYFEKKCDALVCTIEWAKKKGCLV